MGGSRLACKLEDTESGELIHALYLGWIHLVSLLAQCRVDSDPVRLGFKHYPPGCNRVQIDPEGPDFNSHEAKIFKTLNCGTRSTSRVLVLFVILFL